MAIQKKIQLYVSDSTGATKTAKYYRIPLPGDSKPANRTDNIYKDLVRFYAKVSADRFYIGIVFKEGADDAFVPYRDIVESDRLSSITANLTPYIPDKLINNGEGFIKFDTVYEHGNGFIDDILLNSMKKGDFSEFDKRYQYWYKRKKKNNLFSECIESDSENDLSEFVPSNWIEFDTIDAVLQDIQTWGEATPENRGPVFTLHTIDEAKRYINNNFEKLFPQIDIKSHRETDKYHLIPDAYCVKPFDGNALINISTDRIIDNSKAYVIYFANSGSGYSWENHIEEVAFEYGLAKVNFTNTHRNEFGVVLNQAIIMLSHDLIGSRMMVSAIEMGEPE